MIAVSGKTDIVNGTMADTSIKQQARELVDSLPDDATWEDVLERISMRRAIERGLLDARAGRTMTTDELLERLDLDE